MPKEREQKPLRVSALIDPTLDLSKTLKKAGARTTGKEIWNVQDAYERPIGEHYQEFILGKDKGAQGTPEFYSIRYWPAKFFENSWTNLYHLGNKLGDDKRDMEVSTTDPYTTMESLSGI
ncbi:MAG: hypothetical protein GOV15_04095, partial [Candidatus Diapherotrites archaeon]|nr:hypothetical protein [Candidatus Diapherotrites archaeon]